jgi:hypothetical protein
MAEHKVQGGTMLLFIDPNGGTDYDVVVCLTSVGKSDSVTVVDASSACGPDKSPGTLEISYSFEGQHLQDPDTGKISGTDLRSLLRSETTIGWKIAPEVPVQGDEIEYGTGYLSELSSTYAFDSVGTFTGTLQPFGTPTIEIVGGLAVGDAYEGGKIAWLDGTGEHGIIITGANVISGMLYGDFYTAWSTPNNVLTSATASAWGQGGVNTPLIIAATSTSLALDCDTFSYGGYNDWVMPTNDDMANIASNGNTLQISYDLFWTSTEADALTANTIDWTGSVIPGTTFKNSSLSCFAVRYF